MSNRKAAASAMALALALLATACGREVSRPDIVVLVLDTVRPELLSAYGYPRPTSPFLESFARTGTRFERAYSSSSWTLPAHGSLFTGAPPAVHHANQTDRRVDARLPMLQERLSEAGYETAAFSANMWVSELGGFDRGFDRFANLNRGIYPRHTRRLAQDSEGRRQSPGDHYVVRRVVDWLERRGDRDRPYFLFVNLVDAHLPYLPDWHSARPFLPSRAARREAIRRYFPRADADVLVYRHYGRQRPLGASELQLLRGMYEGALRQTDELARTILSAVDATGDPERTVVFVLSDHGENLGDHGHVAHFFNLYDSNLRIPLLVRGPGFDAGASDDRLVQIADVHATALAYAGLRPGPAALGMDLRGAIPDDRIAVATLEHPSISLDLMRPIAGSGRLAPYRVALDAAIDGRFKLIRSTDPAGRVVREELYDLEIDPHEQRPLDLGAVDPERLDRLRSALRTPTSTRSRDGIEPLEALDENVLEGLRALGYVADPESPPESPPTSAKVPQTP